MLERRSPHEAAEKWVHSHPDKVAEWVAGISSTKSNYRSETHERDDVGALLERVAIGIAVSRVLVADLTDREHEQQI